MEKMFREYHKFTEEEFGHLWKNCLFIFDTNTLLNMYRYSRDTVDAYIKVLEELRSKNQLWIPYQVGYEFYENRIEVIFEYEKSYDEILSIIGRTQNEIQQRYKNHPFLDLNNIGADISKGLSGVITNIKQKKDNHPRWMEKDEVLEKLNKIFEGNIGSNFDEDRFKKIKEEGKDRYDKKIPPGFKDSQKPEDRRYGDLVLWYQILDKAKDSRKPVILISGDIKEDWWLQKDGKRLMPLPQLKKEMLDKAGVDFHIYTADNFLEVYSSGKTIDQKTIKEVRKIREMEEERMKRRIESRFLERDLEPRTLERRFMEYISVYQTLQDVLVDIHKIETPTEQTTELEHLGQRIRGLYDRCKHDGIDELAMHRLHRYGKEISFNLEKIVSSEDIDPQINIRLRECLEKLEHANHVSRRYR